MERRYFLSNCWKYYTVLEEDFFGLSRYIDIREVNYCCCSDEIIKQFLAVGSEFDNICKVVCGFNLGDYKNIKNYADWINDNIDQINDKKIIMLESTKNIELFPFKDWNIDEPGKLFWWKAYNEVKHNRIENYIEGNLKNLMNSLAALYFMLMYLAKKIGEENNDIDVPNSRSRLFRIDGWKTEHSVNGYDSYFATEKECEKMAKKIFGEV